jgi:hypothetical protein
MEHSRLNTSILDHVFLLIILSEENWVKQKSPTERSHHPSTKVDVFLLTMPRDIYMWNINQDSWL